MSERPFGTRFTTASGGVRGWSRCFVMISSAVLHFARDDAHFDAMVREMWRVLRPGGMLWARLASTLLPDDHYSYLVSPEQLEQLTGRLGGQLLDPIKTTVVHGQRAMSTWVVRKN